MKPLPLPLRLAAGLVATAIEEVQELPRKLIELPVTAVSQVLQASMRMQQRVTELAIRGDQALGGLRTVPETPTWARFDEDETEGMPFGGGGGPFGGGMDHPFGSRDRSYSGGNEIGGKHPDAGWKAPTPRTVSPIRIARDPEPSAREDFDDLAFGTNRAALPATDPADPSAPNPSAPNPSAPNPSAPNPSAPNPSAPNPSKPKATKTAAADRLTNTAGKAPATKPSVGTDAAPGSAAKAGGSSKATKSSKPSKGRKPAEPDAPAAPGPPGLEDYPTWSLPQLRGRFRSLELQDLQDLLTWETSNLDRAPYVTMLSNRIASVTGR